MKNIRNNFLLISFLLLGIFSLHAQTGKKIQGTVKDQSGEALIGVNVVIVESGTDKHGTITDTNGAFSLTIDNPAASLRFSYLGYLTQVHPVAGNEYFNIVLKEEISELQEIVVVGYGTQKKETVTGAVSSISSDQLTTSTNSNLQQNIAGKLTGVKVITNSSEPGAFKSHVDIRGMGEPLVVIDGVASDFATFNRLSSSEVESVTALKDAAASVYGMRAGNGVLLVTTKTGSKSEEKATIEYQGTYGWSHPVGMPKKMNAYDWAMMINEVSENRYSNPKSVYSDEELATFKAAPNYDLYDAFVKDFTPQTTHTINISGSVGSKDQFKYFTSGSYYHEDGMFKSGSMNYERFNFRTNVTGDLGKGISTNVNVGYITDTKNSSFQDTWNLIKWLWFTPPVNPETGDPLTDVYVDGDPNYPLYMGAELNPVVNSDTDNGGGYKKNKSDRFLLQASINWDVPFVKGLSFKVMYNYKKTNLLYKSWQPKYSLYYKKNDEIIEKSDFVSNTTLVQNLDWMSENGLQASAQYSNKFGNHSVNGLLLLERSEYRAQYMGAQRYFPMEFIDELPAGDADKSQIIGATYPTHMRRQGLVGRVNYDYAGKYLAEFSFRRDGSSKYLGDNVWGFFPGGLIGWRISEENFIKNTEFLSFVNNLKIRASYGLTGDDSGGNYQWASGYDYPGGVYYFGDDKSVGVNDRGAVNLDFTWLINTFKNVGVDWDFWNGMLGGSFEVFQRDRDGLPAKRNLTIPHVAGISLPDENLNSDRTSGWELTLTHNNKINDFRYGVRGNMVFSKRKSLDVERSPSTSSYRNWRENSEDRNQGIWWLMEWGGVITPGTDISSLPIEEGTYQNSLYGVGDFYHLDLNGDGYVNGEDVMPLRTTGYPKIQYGLTLEASWKGIDVNLHFMGAGKKYVMYEEFLKMPYAFSGTAGALDFHKDRWHQDENGNWIEGTYPRYRDINFGANYRNDTWRVKNAAYLKLKSAEIGYTLPAKWTKKAGIERLRVYVNGFNLLTFSKIKHMDPEYPGWNVDDPEYGDDTNWGYVYPTTQNYNMGISVTF